MSEIKMSGLPSMTIDKMLPHLEEAYAGVIRAGVPVKTLPSVMLWGPPGIGKSQAVKQLAGRLAKKTGKEVRVTDVRLLLFNPIDLRGIPTANADKTLAVWLRPQIFNMDGSDNVVNILFLDELTAAPQSVQAAAYQITLDRVVGEHKLPENCIVIAAGNRTTDKSVAFKMPKALANRLLHIDVKGSFTAWKKWAIPTGIHPKVLGFLSFRQDFLNRFDPTVEEYAFPTPRSWEMVSNLLTYVSDDLTHMYPLISGLVGSGAAMELRTWAEVYSLLPKIEDIFDGRSPAVPKRTDALYALVSSMVQYAREHKDEMDKIANSIRYANQLPPEFSAILLRDYLYIDEDYKKRLLTVPEFSRWLSQKGRLINGVV